MSEDEGLSGFIEEDSGAATVELPTEFSMNTYQDLMHHFKIICQLFVHLAVRESDERESFMERSLKGQCLTPRQVRFSHHDCRHILLSSLANSAAKADRDQRLQRGLLDLAPQVQGSFGDVPGV